MRGKTEYVEPAADRRALPAVAHGFIASKALFVASRSTCSPRLAEGGRTVDELAARIAVADNRWRETARGAARRRATTGSPGAELECAGGAVA